jgi:hypothetical protein
LRKLLPEPGSFATTGNLLSSKLKMVLTVLCLLSMSLAADNSASGSYHNLRMNTGGIPERCSVWFDGCNICKRKRRHLMPDLWACTRKHCEQLEEAKCLKWDKSGYNSFNKIKDGTANRPAHLKSMEVSRRLQEYGSRARCRECMGYWQQEGCGQSCVRKCMANQGNEHKWCWHQCMQECECQDACRKKPEAN